MTVKYPTYCEWKKILHKKVDDAPEPYERVLKGIPNTDPIKQFRDNIKRTQKELHDYINKQLPGC
ncbi:MAG: hypothetical protein ACRD5B_03820 [Nitrososphaeraceae archaeon]|jgi:hypothetical protein